ncbi:MAG: RpiB/LacA/LacB family sugar-phosphate isomerase, partial [Peptococcaceae bacterium]|nr:RpiB/LacA/LacB family sugar-phosphate isomerase [Peptococcaceae bacterium]
YGFKVGELVVTKQADYGIVVCGTGIGISIAANKVKGIRAALCTNSYMARMSREHNNANVLALGARVIGPGLALDIVETFLTTDFGGERHKRRVDQIADFELSC